MKINISPKTKEPKEQISPISSGGDLVLSTDLTIESVDSYIDEITGFTVFTADYHRRRGYCCKSGCRHCPYGFLPYEISFRPLGFADLHVVQKWLNERHVDRWWHQAGELADVQAKFGPRISGDEPTFVFLIEFKGESIGWIQWYRWRDYPEHAQQLGAEWTDAGIDVAIGDKNFMGQGIGSRAIFEFVNDYVLTDPEITACIADPEESNGHSIRAFEKAGFVKKHLVQLLGETAIRRVVQLNRQQAP